ncbi:hypothetical protein OAJ77_03055 [Rhodospirillales bacterium]|nr:hypothetical protein [Rhodospirillales bacterium]
MPNRMNDDGMDGEAVVGGERLHGGTTESVQQDGGDHGGVRQPVGRVDHSFHHRSSMDPDAG